MKITDYQVLLYHDLGALSAAIMQYVARGWEPLGGVAISDDITTDGDGDVSSCSYYAQAMVLPETKHDQR